jgi:hypothetical protein
MSVSQSQSQSVTSESRRPASRKTIDMSKYDVSPAQFEELVERVVSHFDAYDSVSGKFSSSVPKGAKLNTEEGEVVTRANVRKMKNAIKAEIRDFKRYFQVAKKSRKRDPYERDSNGQIVYEEVEGRQVPRMKPYRNNGFRNPMFVSKAIRDFFRDANIGYVHPDDPKSGRLNTKLGLLLDGEGQFNGYGVTSSALLTPLFCIYAHVNNLTKLARANQGKNEKVWNRQWLGVDERMEKMLGKELEILEKVTASSGKKFDRHNFRYADFQKIVAINRRNDKGTLPKYGDIPTPAGPALTQEEVNLLTDSDLRAALNEEWTMVHDNLDAYRVKSQPLNKALRAEQRRKSKQSPKDGSQSASQTVEEAPVAATSAAKPSPTVSKASSKPAAKKSGK